jgi:hypothetical protein
MPPIPEAVLETLSEIFDLPFAETIAVALVTLSVAWLREKLKYRLFHKVWDRLADKRKEIHVVFPSFNVKQFEIEIVKKKSRIPGNIFLIPLAESLGISRLIQVFEKVYRGKKVILHSSDSFGFLTEDFVTIGGPSINRITDLLLNQHNLDCSLKIIYPDHYVEDQCDAETYRVQELNGEIKNDFGFTIISKNPFNPKAVVFILYGVWAHGTNSAIQTLTNVIIDKQQTPSVRRLVDRLDAQGEVVLVTESKIHGFTTGVPNIIKIRDVVKSMDISTNKNFFLERF